MYVVVFVWDKMTWKKFVWKSFSFCSFLVRCVGWRKKSIAPSGTTIERLDHHPGHTTLIRKQPTGTTKKRKGDHRSRGGTLVLLIFLVGILIIIKHSLALLFLNTPKLKLNNKNIYTQLKSYQILNTNLKHNFSCSIVVLK